MFRFYFRHIQRGLMVLIIGHLLNACTSMESRLSIEPYIKDKQKRNAVEWMAERYCRKKRNYPQSQGVNKQPDFIFTTDGCSRAPDVHWLACCIVHDISYWCGGSQTDRAAADYLLKQCVTHQSGVMASVFYSGVRMGGTPWLPTPWRWGYGWDDWPRGYELLEHSPTVFELMEELKANQVIEEQLQK
ncbi:MAG: hypothetical protein HOP23_15240 [Methylococcaceae bacterium]|nr:hypothetical protein [Methylococcaceae bacterium]